MGDVLLYFGIVVVGGVIGGGQIDDFLWIGLCCCQGQVFCVGIFVVVGVVEDEVVMLG